MTPPAPHRPLALVVPVAIVCTLPMAGCDSVNEESFEQVQVGMTLDQVEDILGGTGTSEDVGGASISGAGVLSGSRGDLAQKTYSWKSGQKMIIVTVIDGKVVGKSKRGF